jgi:hypothetical protein
MRAERSEAVEEQDDDAQLTRPRSQATGHETRGRSLSAPARRPRQITPRTASAPRTSPTAGRPRLLCSASGSPRHRRSRARCGRAPGVRRRAIRPLRAPAFLESSGHAPAIAFHATEWRARMRRWTAALLLPVDATASGEPARKLARDDVRLSRAARRRSRVRPRGRAHRPAVRHSNSPRGRFLGDFLATRCCVFGLPEPNLPFGRRSTEPKVRGSNPLGRAPQNWL